MVVVTGGGSGMGAATARLFADEGATVVVVDRNAESADSVAAEVGGEARIGDVSDPAFCVEAVDGVVAAASVADHLISLLLEGLLQVEADNGLVLGQHDPHLRRRRRGVVLRCGLVRERLVRQRR